MQLEYSLVERAIEHEFVPLGTTHGMGIMVWSPLASGLLSGKYRASDGGYVGEGRIAALKDWKNPGFQKLRDPRNQPIVELEAVGRELGHSMAQVAINWTVHRHGVASVLVGATKLSQLLENLGALDFDMPAELRALLDEVSRPPRPFPYHFFGNQIQASVKGDTSVGDKPEGYRPAVATPPGRSGALPEWRHTVPRRGAATWYGRVQWRILVARLGGSRR